MSQCILRPTDGSEAEATVAMGDAVTLLAMANETHAVDVADARNLRHGDAPPVRSKRVDAA